MTRYEGSRTSAGGPQAVRVHRDGQPVEQLEHRRRHSPTGLEWGFGGSGPADLALAILWDHLGHEPSPAMYQAFKVEFVALWHDTWEITSERIDEWLDEWLEDMPVAG